MLTKLTITGSDNGLSPGRRQAIIWTNAKILLIGALGTNVSEILIKIDTFSLKKMHLKMTSGKGRPSCLGLNVLIFAIMLKGKTVEQFSFLIMIRETLPIHLLCRVAAISNEVVVISNITLRLKSNKLSKLYVQ